MNGEKYRIAQFGAFDVDSYGDSLFPTILKTQTEYLGCLENITLFSPTCKFEGYNGNCVHSFDEFVELHNENKFDCIVIGGGELFHFNAIRFQNSLGLQVYEEGVLWKRPLLWAKEYNIPVIVNAVGVPYSFSDEQKEFLKDILSPVKYFAVRDEYSYARMQGIVPNDVLTVVPDTVWCLDRIYTTEQCNSVRREISLKYNLNLQIPYIVLQYGTTYQLKTVINQIRTIYQQTNMQIIVIPINHVHEDLDVIAEIECCHLMGITCISELLQPIEIASIIMGATLFIGTSLHGNLTAMRYGVKSIAIDMYPTIASKIDGIFACVGMDEYVIFDVFLLADTVQRLINDEEYYSALSYKLQQIDVQLTDHFKEMFRCLGNDSKRLLLTENEQSVFKKMYVQWIDHNDCRISKKVVAKKDSDEFCFLFEIGAMKQNHIEICFIIDGVTNIRIDKVLIDDQLYSGDIERLSANIDDKYLERIVRFQLNEICEGKVKLYCCIQQNISTNIEQAYFLLLNNKNMHIEQLLEVEREYQREMQNYVSKEYFEMLIAQKDEELAQKDEESAQKDIQINNQCGHIEQLLEVDRHYQNIVNSRGWKIISFPGCVIEKILPVGTPRRQRVNLLAKYIKAFNWSNIKFVCGAFRKGGFKQVKKELNDFEYRMSGVTELPMKTPEIVEIDEIKSLGECEKLIFEKHQSPTVSIVIPVYNQFTYTYNCLKSILQNSGEIEYEIIIADDVSTDLTTRLSEVAGNINIVRNKENQRFLKNCNNAAKHAKGRYILFLNNDTQVQENWLQPLVDLIERDDTIGMVGSKLIYPDGTLQEAGGIIWGNGNAWNYGNGQNPANPEFNYVKEVDYISGAAIMIRTSLWKEIGGFDEYFAPAYCEDSDLAFEVRKHGYKLMYQPLSVVVHFEGKSNGTDLNSGVKQYQVDNSRKLQEKWKAEFAKQSPTEDDLFHAKDRSQGKKTILVVDHYVPQFDKDAGSKTTWQYLKMFVRMGYNVKFIGDNFYQHEPYCTALQQEGIEVLYGPWYAQNYKQWIIDNQDNIDFVYLNRPHITEKYIDFLKEETNIKCIYYGHDLHFLRLMREYELNGDDKVLQESEEWRKKEFDIMKKAAINYYPSYIEVDEIHKIDNNIPAKAITAYVYEEFLENINIDFAKKEGLLFVGGFGHPPNADAVAWFVENVYPLIRKEQDIPFYIVGSNAPDSIKKLNGKNGIVVKGFVSEEELAELYDTCKIVVVPLRYGAGVKGKVVEALYNGSPMVSTTVGIEGIQGAEEFMEVSDDATEFAEKVLELYNNHDKLAETVKAYQSYVKEHNSIEAVWNIVKEDFQ